MAITADMVKKLRDQTGAGMMDCKKALAETDGDYEKAVTLLREKGIAVAAKREARAASEGLIGSYITPDSKTGALVELNCETTFVAKTDEFVQLAKDLAKFVAESAPNDEASLIGAAFRKGQTVGETISEIMGKVGEKLTLSRFARLSTDGLIGSYIHMGDQIGVLVELTGASGEEALQLAKDIAMHVSWSNPEFLNRDQVSEEMIQKERDINKQWAIKEGKPEKVIDRIVDGRMTEYYSRVCLLEQSYIKDEEQTIQALLDSASKKSGQKITIARYMRYRVGDRAVDAE